MLSTYKKKQASEIAKILATEGMLFGKELEEYIKLNEMDGILRLKENEMDEFIDEVIKKVENQWRKTVLMYDKKNNITKLFINTEEVAKEINISMRTVYSSKKINSCINNRYILSIYKPGIKDLKLGLRNITKS